MPKPKSKEKEVTEIIEIQTGIIECYILGRTPLILNRMSEKAAHELLLPRKKTAADRAANLKHNPPEEFRASAYRSIEKTAETRILLPSTAFKRALRDVAVDIPGASKAEIGRLTFVEDTYIPVFGIPQLFMAITRSSDINRTPDVRTRAIVPKWACKVRIRYVIPLLREKDVANLLAAAGIMRGIGDWRPEKGSGNFGQFEIVSENDPRWKEVKNSGGIVDQDAAFASPDCYDAETADLLAWFIDEADRRGFKQTESLPVKKGKR